MNIYHYHPETGLYLGQGVADPSPLEPGVWLIPAHATSTEPPAVEDGEQTVWLDDAWTVQPIPEPPAEPEPAPPVQPEPEPERTPAEKLALLGLSVEELKELLGIE
jgi:hypothetical protein